MSVAKLAIAGIAVLLMVVIYLRFFRKPPHPEGPVYYTQAQWQQQYYRPPSR